MTLLIVRQLIFQQDGNVVLCLCLLVAFSYPRLHMCVCQTAPVLGPPTRATHRLPMIYWIYNRVQNHFHVILSLCVV